MSGASTILFADVAGSTRLYEALGDTAAMRHIGALLGALGEVAARHGGRVVKTIGDEIMCLLPTADAALATACEMQSLASRRPAVSGFRLELRVGFHCGAVIEEAGDVFGDTVNLAARVVGLSKGRQILATRQVVDAIPPYLRNCVRPFGALPVRGRQEGVEIFDVIWSNADDLTVVGNWSEAGEIAAAALRLAHGAEVRRLDETLPSVTLGRDRTNDIVVASRLASRQHARIELRHGKFVLIDASSNGTYVRFGSSEELIIKREELPLHGYGSISLGMSAREDGSDALSFDCEGEAGDAARP